MASQAITTTPTALTGLDPGVAYVVQFRSSSKSYVQTATTAPTDSREAFVVGTNGVVTVKRTSAQSIWVWADSAGGFVVHDQAV